MNEAGTRAQKWRGWAAIALGIIATVLAFLVIGRGLDGASRRANHVLATDLALGATLEPLDPATAKALGDGNSPRDMVVTSVASGGPADKAGVRVGDVIEAIDGAPPGLMTEVPSTLGKSPISMVVNRHGKRAKIRLLIRSPEVRE